MDEIGQITDYVQARAGYDADLIWGNGRDETLGDEISVTIIATGFSTSSIPEVLAARKVEKSYHTLTENQANSVAGGNAANQANGRPSSMSRPVQPQVQQPAARQETFRFQSERPKDDFDSLYSNVKRTNVAPPTAERVQFNDDFTNAIDDDIDRFENIPAYLRRDIRKKPQDAGEDRKVTRFSLSPDDNNGIYLRENNSYLHDNVD